MKITGQLTQTNGLICASIIYHFLPLLIPVPDVFCLESIKPCLTVLLQSLNN